MEYFLCSLFFYGRPSRGFGAYWGGGASAYGSGSLEEGSLGGRDALALAQGQSERMLACRLGMRWQCSESVLSRPIAALAAGARLFGGEVGRVRRDADGGALIADRARETERKTRGRKQCTGRLMGARRRLHTSTAW